jgi:hypothetical protein
LIVACIEVTHYDDDRSAGKVIGGKMAQWQPGTKNGQKLFRRLDGLWLIMMMFRPETLDGTRTVIVISRGKKYKTQKPHLEYIVARADIHTALMAYDAGKFVRWYENPTEAANRIQTEEGTDEDETASFN